MTLLTTISDEAINENLEKRWKNGEIYTYIGGVLISVNPFRGGSSVLSFSMKSVRPNGTCASHRSRHLY